VKLRNIFAEWFHKLRLSDIDEYLLTEEDMLREDPILQILSQMEQANDQKTNTPGQVTGDSGINQGEQPNASV
jgi:hypothetical protein